MAENIYEKLYDAEWARRNDLIAASSVPLGVLALLGSAVFLLVKEYETGGGLLDEIFWTCLALSLSAYSSSVYFLVRSYHGYRYHQIPYPSELRRYGDALKERFTTEGVPLLAERSFQAFLEERFASAAERNMENNIRREVYLQRTNRAIILCLIVVAATTAAFAIRARRGTPASPRSTSSPTSAEMSSSPKADAGKHGTSLPPMPVPPPNVEVKLPLQRPGQPR